MSFSYLDLEEQLISLKNNGYKYITLKDFFENGKVGYSNIVINRIDVDISIAKAWEVFKILRSHDIKATWFFRFCSPKYNLFEYSTINLIKEIATSGHEIGLHTELQDLNKICGLDPEIQLMKQVKIIKQYYEIDMFGTACHGDLTGYNNLDFWKSRKPSDFGFLYEAYDQNLWKNCRYISDSEWVRWKSYNNGVLQVGDHRTPKEHAEDKPDVIYLLTHPDTYYHKSIHEG
ncbi:polysaccharide deacetylase family protein [Vibrio scophthalmi]|uniref:NodB homology domain-containing protein n=1 Tax=Vibrio scophthalmi TaxID=45658 RepID=A0A1E3WJI9_9VIBR|nr:polysaccharide deacetylase family protein [Vibrio scophthalmi]ODS09944.1 hypothetical protein VSF3289_00182 [Vibrio scophthalmi]